MKLTVAHRSLKVIVDRIVMFLVRRNYHSLNMRRILVKSILADMPEIARKEIVASLIPPGKHIHGNPTKKGKQIA